MQGHFGHIALALPVVNSICLKQLKWIVKHICKCKEIIKTIDFKDTTKDHLQDRINILLINEKLINKINRNLNSYPVNEGNTNTGTSQALSSNSHFANSDNDSTSDSSVTPQTLLKGSETTSTKSIPDLSIGLLTPTKKIVENAETNPSKKTWTQ